MTSTVYLNNAASAWPRAPGVARAVAACLDAIPTHPGRSLSSSSHVISACRRRLARLLGVGDPSRIALTQNATHALNLAILGVGLNPGDQVVTTVMEHNSVLRPLAYLEDRVGIRVHLVGLDRDGAIDLEAFQQALEQGPRLVVVTHASNVTGRVNPVTQLFCDAKRAGAITLLDASQSLGHFPVNAIDLCADMVAITGHKGLRGPAGTGALYVAPELELNQVLVGGTGVQSDLRRHPTNMPDRLEAGTPNVPALAGLAEALHWLQNTLDPFQSREQQTADRLRQGLREISELQLYDDVPGCQRLAVISFRIKGWNVEETGYILAESFKIVCRAGLHCAPLIHRSIGSEPEGTVRFSPSGNTTDDEIDQAIDAVKILAGQRSS